MTTTTRHSHSRHRIGRRVSVRTGVSALALALGLTTTGCTGQLVDSFRLAQQEQTFNSQLQINTKIDLLWVVDNSSSMDSTQEKLRAGFAAFANKYMQPTWDIRVAVITTDTYLANPAFQPWLNTVISSSTVNNWTSTYVSSRLASWVNPTPRTSGDLVNLDSSSADYGKFPSGILYNDLVPSWGPDYAKLLPGNHDGPITGFCFEGLPYFISGPSNCSVRDQNAYTDASHCLSPGGAESSLEQCVNTTQNNTVRSGKAIINTMPTTTLTGAALTAWTDQLVKDFKVNVTTGSVGMGSERGFGSVLQLLSDNEASGSATAFFRKDSLRGIVFVSDGDDQTMEIPASPPSGFNPWTGYKCDETTVDAMNGANNTYCCAGGSCTFGSSGTSCPAKSYQIHGASYTVSLCPTNLVSVASVKSQLDTFFQTLDGSGSSGTPNYFVASIVPTVASTVQTLQDQRYLDDAQASQPKTNSIEIGERYIDLGTAVGNGSMALDIGETDYTTLLDSIGQSIIDKKSTFVLSRAPTSAEDMFIKVTHSDGSSEYVPASKYTITGNIIKITDTDLVLSFKATDTIVINYQPRSQN